MTVLVTGAGLKKLSGIERVWLACAIDGEGCIGFYEGGTTRTGNEKWPRAEIKISNSDRRFCDFAKAITGVGTVSEMSRRPDRFARKTMYQWGVHGHVKVKWLLEEVLPYLVIKGEKAKFVLNRIGQRSWGRWKEAKKIEHSERMTRWWKER